jgi:hypothetical protein
MVDILREKEIRLSCMAPDSEQWKEHDAGLEQFKTDIGELVADDLNVAGDTAAETQTIYHYTNVASALAIIETGHFWFTERAHLNDTLELQYGLRIGHEMFDAAVKAAGPTVPQGVADHLMGEVGYTSATVQMPSSAASWRRSFRERRVACLKDSGGP